MEAEVLPVETHATRVMPSRSACATPQVMPLSLNDPVGLKPWCLNVMPVQPAVLRRARRLEQRRVAFAQRHHLAVIVQERKQFAIAPDAALVEGRVGHAPLAPELFPAASASRAGYTASSSPPQRGQL